MKIFDESLKHGAGLSGGVLDSLHTKCDRESYPVLAANPLTPEQTHRLGEKLNAIRQSVMNDLNQTDANYIRKVYAGVVYGELVGRGLLLISAAWHERRSGFGVPKGSLLLWALGTGTLMLSKIVNNMELGHNVMHGQYDWMQDKHLHSQHFDWDIVCPAPLWQHSHNFLHHTFTNVVGRDHDVGYHLIRVTDEQAWAPSDRYNLIKAGVLGLVFEWAVAFHDIQISMEEYQDDPHLPAIMQQKSRALFAKIGRQIGKDAVVMPLVASVLAGRRGALHTLTGNAAANVGRNLWTWAVIFCGHFTDQAHVYTQLDANESRGDWYVRQMLGSSNLTGHRWFHFLTGNLSHQIEHHLFPDMPANRYADIAPKVKAVCDEFGLHYNTGSFKQQFTQVIARIHHFSRPKHDQTKRSRCDALERQPTCYPQVSKRRQRWLNRLPDFLAQAVAYV